VNSRTDHSDPILVAGRRAVAGADAHAAEPEGRHFQVALTQRTLLHCCPSLSTLSGRSEQVGPGGRNVTTFTGRLSACFRARRSPTLYRVPGHQGRGLWMTRDRVVCRKGAHALQPMNFAKEESHDD